MPDTTDQNPQPPTPGQVLAGTPPTQAPAQPAPPQPTPAQVQQVAEWNFILGFLSVIDC